MDWDKTDIIRYLSKLRGYRSYLEICTPTTGNFFAKIEPSQFDVCHRLMYRCRDDFSDGLNIDFRSPTLDIGQCIADIQRGGFRYDIILVDPWHEYETSLRDMRAALDLLTERGSIVVHDCDPPTGDIIEPHFQNGSWCGVTFVAYLDFVKENGDIAYCTIDSDYGCGVVQRKSGAAGGMQTFSCPDLWDTVRTDPQAAFQLARKLRCTLMNMVPVERFIRSEAEAMLTSEQAARAANG